MPCEEKMSWIFNIIQILLRYFGKNMDSLNAENTTAWYKIALKELGVKEFRGAENPRIIEYHQETTLKADEDEISWCSAFVNWVMKQAGHQGTRSALARSWLKWGREVKAPYKGCIVVFERGESWQGHVGFFVHEENGMIGCLGGNQSDAVSIAYYPKSRVLGYREPTP
jgi:uncharacterized protein (TIGR02594 family)